MPIYVSKFWVNNVVNIEVIRQNVFSHARIMVIGVSSDLNTNIRNKKKKHRKTIGVHIQIYSLPN